MKACCTGTTQEQASLERRTELRIGAPVELSISFPDDSAVKSRSDREKFLEIFRNQASFGKNPKVRETEKKRGSFRYDVRALSPSMVRTVVGPKQMARGAIYYGHW